MARRLLKASTAVCGLCLGIAVFVPQGHAAGGQPAAAARYPRNAAEFDESHLVHHEQALGKGPFMVDPLRLALESRDVGQASDLIVSVFVAVLGPDGLAFLERDLQIGGVDSDGLLAKRLQMHLDAAGFGIESSKVPKLLQVEVAIQFAINAYQQV